jgi:GAF domain-containing protein
MVENLVVSRSQNKKERYDTLLPQLQALVSGESDVIANLSNVAAVLKDAMSFFWVGFYRVQDSELVLGPFQGPVACTRIGFGHGVCGTAWKEQRTIIVPDVDKFPGHIACNSASRSEIVLPAFKNNQVALVLDVDSDRLDAFDETDKQALEEIMRIIEKFL